MSVAAHPHCLFITVDQWAAALFGFAGHPTLQTPTIDQLSRLGTTYTKAYSESPICIPARRTMMTGLTPREHGDRSYQPAALMPKAPLLAQVFKDQGYQTAAIGKLHVFPQRNRIGFEEALIAEEGRLNLGAIDDYDLFLADKGFAGEQYMHGMSNNDYQTRPWHLAEPLHVTNWITRAACMSIKRRDPTRPGFWHVSYTHPHPPLVPLSSYLEMYRDMAIDPEVKGSWSLDFEQQPAALKVIKSYWPAQYNSTQHLAIKRAYYALCTHIDHQLRLIIGTLREEGLLNQTVILFTADHGDMLGQHGLWAKSLFYDAVARVPMLLIDVEGSKRVKPGSVDSRLVGLQDIMPTLLDLAGLEAVPGLGGFSMLGDVKRSVFYGECGEGVNASRMITDGLHKLIWYPANHVLQLFNLETDPSECHNLVNDAASASIQARLQQHLIEHLYGTDLGWVKDGQLVGYEPGPFHAKSNRMLSGQRGLHYPPPPIDDPNVSAIRPA
jgi:arylsulfatase A-like enzyme